MLRVCSRSKTLKAQRGHAIFCIQRSSNLCAAHPAVPRRDVLLDVTTTYPSLQQSVEQVVATRKI